MAAVEALEVAPRAVGVAIGVVTGVVIGAGAGLSPAGDSRNTSRTTEITIADSAIPLAISRMRACGDRYHGVGTGLSTATQLFSSNASNPPPCGDSVFGRQVIEVGLGRVILVLVKHVDSVAAVGFLPKVVEVPRGPLLRHHLMLTPRPGQTLVSPPTRGGDRGTR